MVTYLPGTTVAIVNARWDALFAAGIPDHTILIGRCGS